MHKEDKASKLDNANSEDKASADSSSLSLSLTGTRKAPEIAVPCDAGIDLDSDGEDYPLRGDFLRLEFSYSLSSEERRKD